MRLLSESFYLSSSIVAVLCIVSVALQTTSTDKKLWNELQPPFISTSTQKHSAVWPLILKPAYCHNNIIMKAKYNNKLLTLQVSMQETIKMLAARGQRPSGDSLTVSNQSRINGDGFVTGGKTNTEACECVRSVCRGQCLPPAAAGGSSPGTT